MSTAVSINGVEFLVESGKVPQHDRFWMKVNRGVWETETYRVIDEQTDKDTLVIDCGGWIGPTILYTAQRCGYCVGFEPDPVAFATLNANLALNSNTAWAQNVELVNKAIHSTGRPITIAASNKVGGDSMSSMLNPTTSANWKVSTQRLQKVIETYRGDYKKVFVKIDVEGGEYNILPSIADVMADTSVSFLIAFHHRRLKLSYANKTQTGGTSKFLETLQKVVDALPWDREIVTLAGEALDPEKVRKAVANGNGFGAEIIIR